MKPMDLRSIIELQRRDLNMSRYQLARESGLPITTVYAFLRGASDGSATLIAALFRVLNLGVFPFGRDSAAQQWSEKSPLFDPDYKKGSRIGGRAIKAGKDRKRRARS